MANWVFQGNPKRYPILERLRSGEREFGWSCSQHLDDLQGGDNVVLWASGPHAGVYAIGVVDGSPFEDEAGEDWLDPDDHGRTMWFSPLRLTDVRVDNPILKADLLDAGGFENARIIRQPMAGNPTLLTDDEWDVIERLR